MYLIITSQCFELRSSKYCVFLHVACISDNSHHCKRTVLSNMALANLHPQITQGSSQSISYVCGTMRTGWKVSSSLLPQSLHHLLPIKSKFSAVPTSLPVCSRCEMGQQSQQHLRLLTATFWSSFVSTCNWRWAWTIPGAPRDSQCGGSLQLPAAHIGRVERWGKSQAGP